MVIIILGAVILGAGKSVSALTYQYGMPVSFTFNPMIRLNLSSNLVISDLAPGTASDSNIITVNVVANTMYGYKLNATVGNNTTYNTRNLVHSDNTATATFTSVDYATTPTITAISDLDDNTWAYTFSTDNGTTWANYNGLPLYNDETNVALLKESTGPVAEATGDNVNFKIAAKASSSQIAGEYNNVINFIAVATPGPTPQPITCPANTICYAPNALDVEDTMGDQSENDDGSDTGSAITSNMPVNLWPSNFKRERYGFIGWNTELDGSGEMYGPMETITTGDLSTKGLALYATWVESAGYMQNWDGCSAMSIGDVTALTDLRDEDTYAVAKLADGKCWMIENLRLDNTAAHNSDGTLAQGYGQSFVGLADAESPWATNSYAANSLYSTHSGSGITTISGTYLAVRFPRYNNNNTYPSTTVANMTGANQNVYSYGNYYTWPAAIAHTDTTISDTSICLTGWHLPTSGTSGEFYTLNAQVSSGSASSSLGLSVFPNNFLYSGYIYDSSISSRGSRGYYWSHGTRSTEDAYNLLIGKSGVISSTSSSRKYNGLTIRCLAGS